MKRTWKSVLFFTLPVLAGFLYEILITLEPMDGARRDVGLAWDEQHGVPLSSQVDPEGKSVKA